MNQETLISTAISELDELLTELERSRQEAYREKDVSEKTTADLKQQLATKTEILKQAQKNCAEQDARLKTLEGDFAALKAELDAVAKDGAEARQSVAELKQQLAAQAEVMQQAQKSRNEQTARISSLEAELATLKDERDALAKDKAAALQSATDLQQQLTAQAKTLQQAQEARDAQTATVKTLEGDLARVKTQRERVVAGLQHLRHLARPAGKTT